MCLVVYHVLCLACFVCFWWKTLNEAKRAGCKSVGPVPLCLANVLIWLPSSNHKCQVTTTVLLCLCRVSFLVFLCFTFFVLVPLRQ